MDKTGNLVTQRQAHGTDVFGVRVRLVETNSGWAITLRDTLPVLQAALDIGERQARASVSSYRSEGWTWAGGLNDPFTVVTSLTNRILEHRDQRIEAGQENGRKGGRPTKPAWDITPGSGW